MSRLPPNIAASFDGDSPAGSGRVSLRRFQATHAPIVARWVTTDIEARLLAPSTEPPISATKVLDWCRADGQAYVGVLIGESQTMAYAELNPMPHDPHQRWLGHCLLRPDLRGQGLGQAFIGALLHEAFNSLAVSRVSLIVFPENEVAVCCYRRAGFAVVGEEWHSFRKGPYERLLRLEAINPRQHRFASAAQ